MVDVPDIVHPSPAPSVADLPTEHQAVAAWQALPRGTRHDSLLEDRHDLFDATGWRTEFAQIGWQAIFPFAAWVEDRPWTFLWVQFLAFAFGFPLLLIQSYGNRNASLAEAAWVFSLYFSVLWAAFLYRCMRPDPISKRLLLGTWLFTSILGVLSVLFVTALGGMLPGIREVLAASQSANVVGRLIGFTLGVGLIEETAKAAPIIWVVSRRSKPMRPITVAYLGAISGLAFGATEAIMYSISYAAGHRASLIGYGDYLLIQLLRLISLPFLHAVWSAVAGYFVALARISPNSQRALVIIGIGLVSILHGMYDTFANSWIGFLVAIASLFLFVGYVRTEARVVESVTAGMP